MHCCSNQSSQPKIDLRASWLPSGYKIFLEIMRQTRRWSIVEHLTPSSLAPNFVHLSHLHSVLALVSFVLGLDLVIMSWYRAACHLSDEQLLTWVLCNWPRNGQSPPFHTLSWQKFPSKRTSTRPDYLQIAFGKSSRWLLSGRVKPMSSPVRNNILR